MSPRIIDWVKWENRLAETTYWKYEKRQLCTKLVKNVYECTKSAFAQQRNEDESIQAPL